MCAFFVLNPHKALHPFRTEWTKVGTRGCKLRPLKAFLVVSLHVPLFQRVRTLEPICNYVNVKCSCHLILRIISVTSTFTV